MANINNNDGVSQVRQVSLQINTDGVPFKYPIEAVLRHNRYAQANNFACKIALYGDDVHDIAWWGAMARLDTFPVEIIFGSGPPGAIVTQKMMTGQVDKMKIDTRKGIVTIHGRDNFALLIETYVMQSLEGRYVNDVMKEIVERHPGLHYDSQQTNNPPASKMYRQFPIMTMGVQGSPLTNEAQLIDMLAQLANAFPYFEGDTIVLRDYTDIDGTWTVTMTPPRNNGESVVILEPSNATEIILERDLNIARNTRVKVFGYDPVNDQTIMATDTQSQFRDGAVGHSINRVFPGVKDEDELKKLANAMYDKVIRHEKKVHWTEPGSLFLTCLYKMVLDGGDTEWHQEYWIESIDRTMRWDGGFTMECIGSNADPALANDEAY